MGSAAGRTGSGAKNTHLLDGFPIHLSDFTLLGSFLRFMKETLERHEVTTLCGVSGTILLEVTIVFLRTWTDSWLNEEF